MPRPSPLPRQHLPVASLLALLVYIGGFFVLLAKLLQRTQGHFVYSLDDPYIHLALAERIRHGLYGLNAGEPASPSSSILWPFLFVPFAGTAVMTYAPLALNFVLGCCTAWLLGTIVDRGAAGAPFAARRWYTAALAVLLLFGLNAFGLTYTGLEQLLELLLCLGCAYLCVCAAHGGRIPVWTLAAATLLPSVRYEGVLITAAVVVVLWSAQRRSAALLVAVLSLLPLGLFSLFLVHLGLPPIPISVIVKGATVVITGGKIHGLLLIFKGAVKTALHDPERGIVLALTVLSLGLFALHRRNRQWRVVLAVVGATCAVQTLVGPFGWLFRYEIYCIGFAVPVLLAFLLRNRGEVAQVGSVTDTRQPGTLAWTASFALAGALALVFEPALFATLNAAQSVWREQAQLGRLTHDFYHGPVAINDLGLVSYGRDPHAYVLDLYALGSPEVFRMRVKRTLWNHMGDLTREHHIGLVAIYPEWIKDLPPDWQPIAKLCSDDMQYGPAFPRVMLYSTPDSDRPELLDELRRFQQTLGAGTHLELAPTDQSVVCH